MSILYETDSICACCTYIYFLYMRVSANSIGRHLLYTSTIRVHCSSVYQIYHPQPSTLDRHNGLQYYGEKRSYPIACFFCNWPPWTAVVVIVYYAPINSVYTTHNRRTVLLLTCLLILLIILRSMSQQWSVPGTACTCYLSPEYYKYFHMNGTLVLVVKLPAPINMCRKFRGDVKQSVDPPQPKLHNQKTLS